MAKLSFPPDESVLRRFVLGQLPPAELEQIGDYLDAHPELASALDALRGGDTLLAALRSSAAVQVPETPELAALAARIASLASDPESTGALPAEAGEATVSAARERPDLDHAPTAEPEPDSSPGLMGVLAPPELPGEFGRLGGYRVLRLLGRGGMGAVFEAEDAKLGRKVALKVMLPALAANRNAKERFEREARTAAKVEHDHIVPILQVGEDRGAPFIAMRFWSANRWTSRSPPAAPSRWRTPC